MIGAADERRLHQTDLDDFARFAHKDFVDLMLVMVASIMSRLLININNLHEG